MRVAVVILNWNGKKFLEQFLPSVVQHSSDAHIYVADNNSSDDSIAFLNSNYPDITIIQNGENLGFAGGYNAALKDLEEDIFVLLNSDVEVTEGWLNPIVDLIESDSNVAACQPKMLQFDRKDYFEYAGATGGFIDKYGYPFCRGRIFDNLEDDSGQYDNATEVFWATGACLFVRKDAYWKMGGLDEDFFAHMEEIDLCWRLKRAGYRIMVEPKSKVFHVGGGTLPKSNPQKTFLNFRNGLNLMVKNLPEKELFAALFLRMLLDGVAALKFLLTGYPRDFWAVFRAHMAFYFNYSNTKRKRSGSYAEVDGIYNGSIVKAFYLEGKRKFSDLAPSKF